jgi:tetratricopeptide (TPR) repeat protein
MPCPNLYFRPRLASAGDPDTRQIIPTQILINRNFCLFRPYMHAIVILKCLLLFVFARTPGLGQSGAEAVDFVNAGDAAYRMFDRDAALRAYKRASEMDSLDYEAAWKLARAYIDHGETLTDKKARMVHFRQAEKSARRALRIRSHTPEGHLFLSIALGNIALNAGPRERVRLAHEIKSEVDTTLILAPDNAIAWHVLGRWHREVATISWVERQFARILYGGVPAEASLENAAEQLKKYDLAIREYETVLRLAKTDADDAMHQQRAQERLERLRKAR